MAVPSVVTSSSGGGPAAQTITLGAGLSIVVVTTEAQNLPSAASTQINHASSGWTAILGTKGGAGYSAASQYLYAYTKVTTNGETIDTGDSGAFQVYQAITVSGYNASSNYEALANGSDTSSASGVFTVPSLTTLGPDRLILGFVNPRADTGTPIGGGSWTNTNLTISSIVAQQVTAAGGGGLAGFAGDFPADSDGEPCGNTTIDASSSTFNSVPYGYLTLAIKPLAASTYNDTVSGTVSLTGTKTESKVGADSPSGSLALTGSKTEALARACSPTGSTALTGTRSESFAHSTSPTGTVALTGTRSEALSHASGPSGQIGLLGTASEAATYTDILQGTVPVTGSIYMAPVDVKGAVISFATLGISTSFRSLGPSTSIEAPEVTTSHE